MTTDWFDNVYQYQQIAAGCDLTMGTGMPEHTAQMLREGKLSAEDLRTGAGRILKLLLKLA